MQQQIFVLRCILGAKQGNIQNQVDGILNTETTFLHILSLLMQYICY